MSLNLPKSVPLKYRPRIQHWDDERSNGNSLIVSLKSGWRFPVAEGHVQGFDTVRDAIEGLRESEPCSCAECQKSLGVALEIKTSETDGNFKGRRIIVHGCDVTVQCVDGNEYHRRYQNKKDADGANNLIAIYQSEWELCG